MKNTLIASVFALVSTSAFAADVVYEAPAAPMVEAPILFSWSGPYIGVQGGGAWANADVTNSNYGGDYSLDGGLVGGFVGYNHQFNNNFVLGIEGDLDYNWNEDSRAIVRSTVDVGTDLSGSVRARVGYAADRALLYVTGGWATTRGYLEVNNPVASSKFKETFNGWTIGAGVDYAFTDNMFGRLEYRYNDYGSKNFDFGKVDLDQHTVKVGLGVKF